jgi:hypothetical protein
MLSLRLVDSSAHRISRLGQELSSPAAAKITWITLIPISQLLGRYSARQRRTIDAA